MSKIIGLEKIAKRYAEALFALAEKQKSEEKVLADLVLIKEVFLTSEDLKMLVDHPAIKPEVKKEALDKVFKSKVSTEAYNLLMLLVEKRRLNLVSALMEPFRELVLRKQNIDIAKVSSAKPLSESQLKDIKSKLEKVFSKKLEIETHIDDSLIAGVKVNVGDQVLDSSVKSKLKQMKQILNT